MKSKIYLIIALIVISVFCGFAYINLIKTKDATTDVKNMQAGKLAINLYIKIKKNKQFSELNDDDAGNGTIFIMSDVIRNNDDLLVILCGVRSDDMLESVTEYVQSWAKNEGVKNKIILLLYAKAVKQADGSFLLPDDSYFISEKQIH